MKYSALMVILLIAIVIIIPLSVISRNGNCLDNVENIKTNAQNSSSSNNQNIKPLINSEMSQIIKNSEIENNNPIPIQNNNNKKDTIDNSKQSIPTLSNAYNCDSFAILDITTGKINRVSVRDYVIGAVAAEMPPSFHKEALKAQAVSVHTYALRNRNDHMKSPPEELKGADFKADPQNYKGYITQKQAQKMYGDKFPIYWGKISEACDEVLNYVITYEERPILAAYHSTSAGITESASNVWMGSADYLIPVESKGDILSSSYESEFIISKDEFKNILIKNYEDIKLDDDPSKWLNILKRSEGGYVLLIDVGNVTLKGTDIRTLLSLRSSNFDVEYKNENFNFKIFGYGHGVGLSQYGADYMARQGADFAQILLHYYSNVTISKIK